MLTCKQYVACASDSVDAQLTFNERLQARHHWLVCPACRCFTRQLRLVGAALNTLAEPLPVELDTTVALMLGEVSRLK